MIKRQLKNGTFELYDGPLTSHDRQPGAPRCSLCDGENTAEGERVVGLICEPGAGTAGQRFETNVCADCIAGALAVAYGAQHVRHGGAIEDLDPGQ